MCIVRPMRFLPAFLALFFSLAELLRATDLPTVKAALPDLNAAQGGTISAIDLRNHFEVADIVGQVVQFRTNLGTFNAQMLAGAGAATVPNFLAYVNAGAFANSFIHRSVVGLGIIQGGGFNITASAPLALGTIPTNAPIALEYTLPNTRGTLAMARTTEPDSATSGWFINTIDNTNTFGQGNAGGYAVFARVTGTGMSVVDAIQAVPVYNGGGALTTWPLVGYTSGNVVLANLVVVQAVEAVPIFPAQAGQNSVVSFSVTSNSNPALVTPTVGGSALQLLLAAGQSGFADLTVRATDSNGNTAQSSFRLNVAPATPEIVVEQPAGANLADGGSRAFPLTHVGSSTDLGFTIKNTGGGNLALTGTPRVAVDGADAGLFTVTAQPASPVAASGGSTTFTVRFAPTGAGAKTAALHIANDDADENPFDLALTGTGNARPTLTLPASPVIAEPASASGAAVIFSVSANDAEDGALTATAAPASGSIFPLGNTTVNVSATDSNGAQTTGSFTVTVRFARPAVTTRTVGASSGSPAPAGPPNAPKLTTLGAPALSDYRGMVARVTMLANHTTLAGILVEDSAGARSLAAYQTGPVPDIPGVNYKSFLDPVIAPDGAIAFAGTVQGGGVKTTADFGVWSDAFGPVLELVLREGDQAPGLPAGALLRSVTSLSLHDGELLALITLTLKAGVVTSLNDTALVRITGPFAGTLLLREDAPLTVGASAPSAIRTITVFSPALASAGQGRWHGDAGVVAKVTLADRRTVLVKITPAGAATPMLATGGDVAGSTWSAFGLPGVGGAGTKFAALGTLRQLRGAVTSLDDTALAYSADGAAFSLFARENVAAPEAGGAVFASFFDPVVNEAGDVAFLATLRGAGVKTTNRTGLWWGRPTSPSPLDLVARLGSKATASNGAEIDGQVWTAFLTLALPGGAGAGPIFLGKVAGTGVTARNNTGLWAVDSTGRVLLLLRTGGSIGASTKKITAMTLLNALPGTTGAARSYNDAGSIALLATFDDRSQSLVRVDVP